MKEETTDIQKLLRLKRYETPGPEYFEQFLTEFQHRQRVELIRTPLWKIALERVQTWVADFQVPRLAYAGSFAAIALAVGLGLYQENAGSVSSSTLAKAPVHPSTPKEAMSLNAVNAGLPSDSQFQPVSLTTNGSTRYVLETRPVSYGAQNSF